MEHPRKRPPPTPGWDANLVGESTAMSHWMKELLWCHASGTCQKSALWNFLKILGCWGNLFTVRCLTGGTLQSKWPKEGEVMVGRETLGHCMLLPACTTGTQGSSPWDRANGTHNNQEGKLFAFVMSLHNPLVTKLDLSYHLIKKNIYWT